MIRFILALIRLIALALSYMLSTLAAAAFVTFALFLDAEAQWLREDPAVAVGAVGFTLAVWFEVASAVFAPFLLLVLIAELARLTSLTFNTLAGGLLACVYMVLTPYGFDLPYTVQQIWLVALAAGFVGGFTHWALAGHRAGRWMGHAAHDA